MRLSLAPVPYAWSRADLLRFYEEAIHWPLDGVVLGEYVCGKRRELRREDWWAIAEAWAASGREVVLTTPVLPDPDADIQHLRRVVGNGRFSVEANDLTSVALLRKRSLSFVGGPGLNLYNHRDVALFQRAGMTRWVLNPEQGRKDLADFRRYSEGTSPPEVEVVAWGRSALAYSPRCFSARAAGAPKDDCRFVCRDWPEGLPVRTRDGVPFLRLNGVEVQSETLYDLAPEIPLLKQLGVSLLRLVPQPEGTADIVSRFRLAIAGASVPRVGAASRYWPSADAGKAPVAGAGGTRDAPASSPQVAASRSEKEGRGDGGA